MEKNENQKNTELQNLKNKFPKILLLILIGATLMRLTFTIRDNRSLEFNSDEERNFQIASNHRNGLGYTYENKKTAMHGSFPVFTYEFLMKINISKKQWAFFVHALSLILFIGSIFWFHKLCGILFPSQNLCLTATALYSFYPPNIYYIGRLFAYENIVLPLLIFVVLKLVVFLKNRGKNQGIKSISLVTLIVVLSCLYKGNMVLIYLGIFSLYILFTLFDWKHSWRFNMIFLFVLFTFMVVFHLPILMKNHDMFDKYFVSNKTGIGLLMGHNPFARGSWDGNRNNPDSDYFKYQRTEIPNFDDLDEYHQSRLSKKIALKWILSHPKEEILLMVRKLLIYFLPRNYEGNYNVLNIIVHALFLISLVWTVIHFKKFQRQDFLILSPVLASIFVSFVFFVGYRWRYYAEPFMILYSILVIQKYVLSRRMCFPG